MFNESTKISFWREIMSKKVFILCIALIFVIVFAACGNQPRPPASNGAPATTQPQPPASDGAPATAQPQTDQGQPTEPQTRTITDLDGNIIEVPMVIERTANLWAANNQVMILLGYGHTLVATTQFVKDLEWMNRLNPMLADAPAVHSGDEINIEELLETNPCVIIMSASPNAADAARRTGIPVVEMLFHDYEGLMDVVQITADIFGTDEALARANQFNDHFRRNINMVTERVAQIPEEEKNHGIFYIRGDRSIYTSDGKGTMASIWSQIVGAHNIADSAFDSFGREMAFEDILAADPDFIILQDTNNPEAIREQLYQDPRWQEISAIRNRNVFVNPLGVFFWERFSAEQAMQVLWIAKTVHPDYFEDLDMVAETQYFYQTFFNYPMTVDEANEILNTEVNARR